LTSHVPSRNDKRDDPSIAPTAYVVAIFVVVFVITVIGLQAYFGRVKSEEEQSKIVDPTVKALADLRAEQEARLAGYRWVSADSGLVALPIERAMALVARDLERGSGAAAPSPEPARSRN
jgi:hypothetical protein